ncbi:hypothetical protein ACFO25_00575 [Paenactinomyces guangxiensis]|uniref:Uncharacterized protein n=1 Tax=Paenactinomyces guangxiensis TaxID=1490290 RepID=A0A7W1WSD2_9BACL|nr:hypothetical protein [Paenactinomyces guangxiensis]MBA4495188.1 hypothetical protein [Paenactinomyces guangxiensis]MBH8592272.1 hypothetical protein [Paenactinomyces guangxiensis]
MLPGDLRQILYQNLKNEEEETLENLKKVFHYPFPDETDLLLFEMQGVEYLNITAFPFTGYASQLTHNTHGENLTADLNLFSYNLLKGFPDEPMEDHILADTEEEFINWFAKQWEKAGGSYFPYPCYLTIHGGGELYDLSRREWLDDAEKLWDSFFE